MKNINESTDTICDMKNLFYHLSSGVPLTRQKASCAPHGKGAFQFSHTERRSHRAPPVSFCTKRIVLINY